MSARTERLLRRANLAHYRAMTTPSFAERLLAETWRLRWMRAAMEDWS